VVYELTKASSANPHLIEKMDGVVGSEEVAAKAIAALGMRVHLVSEAIGGACVAMEMNVDALLDIVVSVLVDDRAVLNQVVADEKALNPGITRDNVVERAGIEPATLLRHDFKLL